MRIHFLAFQIPYSCIKAYLPFPLPSTACIICNSLYIFLIYDVVVPSEQFNTSTTFEFPNTSDPNYSNISINLRFVLEEYFESIIIFLISRVSLSNPTFFLDLYRF